MTFDLFFRGALIVYAAGYAVALIRALRSGRWQEAGRSYQRAVEPRAFWRELGLALLRVSLALAAVFVIPGPSREDPYPEYGIAFCLILFAPAVIRALWVGRIEFGAHNRWGRGDAPYWVMTLIGVGLVAAVAYILALDLSGH